MPNTSCIPKIKNKIYLYNTYIYIRIIHDIYIIHKLNICVINFLIIFLLLDIPLQNITPTKPSPQITLRNINLMWDIHTIKDANKSIIEQQEKDGIKHYIWDGVHSKSVTIYKSKSNKIITI